MHHGERSTNQTQGIIFDFDGLIFDTETPDYDAWREVYALYGVELTMDVWARGLGVSSRDFTPADHLAQLIDGRATKEKLRAEHRSAFTSIIGDLSPMPGVLEYLAAATDLGLKLGIASSATTDWVLGHLERHKMVEYFDCIRCIEHVSCGKPDPELYIAVTVELNLDPCQIIALEDSPNGVTAAKRAGLYCVAVVNSVSRQLPLENADLRVESLVDLPLDTLLALRYP